MYVKSQHPHPKKHLQFLPKSITFSNLKEMHFIQHSPKHMDHSKHFCRPPLTYFHAHTHKLEASYTVPPVHQEIHTSTDCHRDGVREAALFWGLVRDGWYTANKISETQDRNTFNPFCTLHSVMRSGFQKLGWIGSWIIILCLTCARCILCKST